MALKIRIEIGDVREHGCDVLILKYAQRRYGADKVVARALNLRGVSEDDMSPRPGRYHVIDSSGAVSAKHVMFVGVDPLSVFGYRQIRVFARQALEYLASFDPSIAHVAFTMHGPGYGLDEREAFESLIAGILDTSTAYDISRHLVGIDIVEWDLGRAGRLSEYLSDLRIDLAPSSETAFPNKSSDAQERLREVGYSSDAKPHVFVAMPFSDSKSDHYHYGIQGAVHRAGFLCERADLTTFTGDVLGWVKDRISGATMVIADLSGANPNVYLEVGYAWGRNIPTILLTDDVSDLKFDIQGQRCLAYSNIRELEKKLAAELVHLRSH